MTAASPASAAGSFALDRLTGGAAGETVLVRERAGVGRVTVTVLDPVADLDVVHAWVTAPRAAFWGMQGLGPAEVGEVYAGVDSLATHHAFLVRWDDVPVALLQTYAPEHDPVGECYPVRPGDVGMHFLLGGRGRPGVPLWPVVAPVVREHLLAPPGARRVVVEPDARNARALGRLVALGFDLGPTAPLGEKVARLAFYTPPDRTTRATGSTTRPRTELAP